MVESLERREVLSSATFTPFVTLPGQVTTAGKPAEVTVDFPAGSISSSASQSVLVGFYAQAASGSSETPVITGVQGITGSLTRVVMPKRGGLAPSKSLFFAYLNASTAAQEITVDVSEPGKSVGNFNLEAFLPGDANGDGTVNQADLTLIKAAYGTALGQALNDPAADFNADGHVGCIDLRLAQNNLGASIHYSQPATTTAASIPMAAPAIIPTPAPTPAPTVATPAVTTPAVTPAAPVATPVVPTPVTTTTTTSVAAASSAAAASASTAAAGGSTAGSPAAASASTAEAATTSTTSSASTATPTPLVVQPVPVVLSQPAPYLAYVYPQTGEIVPVPAPTATPAQVYYYGQPVVQAAGYVPAPTTVTIPQPASTSSTATAPPLVVYYASSQAAASAKVA